MTLVSRCGEELRLRRRLDRAGARFSGEGSVVEERVESSGITAGVCCTTGPVEDCGTAD